MKKYLSLLAIPIGFLKLDDSIFTEIPENRSILIGSYKKHLYLLTNEQSKFDEWGGFVQKQVI